MSDFETDFDAFLQQTQTQPPAQPQQQQSETQTQQLPVDEPQALQTQQPSQPAPQAADANLPFPNFDKLPEETQRSILARISQADEARKAKELEAAKAAHELNALKGRVAPTQQALEAARREAAELRKKQETQVSPELERRRKELSEALPQEAELISAHLTPIQQEMERLRKEREEFAKERQFYAAEQQFNRAIGELTAHRPTWKNDLPMLKAWIEVLPAEDQELAKEWMSTPELHPDAAKNNIRLWRMFERDEAMAKEYLAQGEPNQSKAAERIKQAMDTDPNPRGRQSPGNASAASAYTSQFESDFDNWLKTSQR